MWGRKRDERQKYGGVIERPKSLPSAEKPMTPPRWYLRRRDAMSTEREIARMRAEDPFGAPDRDLDYPVSTLLDLPTIDALDRLVVEEGWVYRSALLRHLVETYLTQRSALPM